jgi:hypothetical protein
VVDTIDEVLKFALEDDKSDEALETPQIWRAESATSDLPIPLD